MCRENFEIVATSALLGPTANMERIDKKLPDGTITRLIAELKKVHGLNREVGTGVCKGCAAELLRLITETVRPHQIRALKKIAKNSISFSPTSARTRAAKII